MKSKSFSNLIVFFLILHLTSFAQNKKIKVNVDSLYHVLTQTSNTKEKVNSLISLYKKSIKQRDIRKDILDEALEISEKIYYIKGVGICYNRKGITARYEENFAQSIILHKRALSYIEQTTDTFQITKCLISIAVTYRKLNLEKEAFTNYLRALKLSEKINDKKGVSFSLNGIGNIYLNIEQYDKALIYLKQALQAEKETNNIKGQEYDYANIGEAFLYLKQYDSAYYNFNKSLDLAKSRPSKENIAIKHVAFGLYYQKINEYEKSIVSYNKALPDLRKYKNTRYESKSLLNIGVDQLYLKQYDKAYKNIINGLTLARKINSKENISLGYEALVDYYSKTNDYKKALAAHKQAKVYHDSIINVSSQKSIISTRIAYETEEKDKQIYSLALEKNNSENKAKNNFNRFIITAIVSLISIVLLLVFIYLYRKNSDLEIQRKNAELQNYILKISELKSVNSETTDKDISEGFKEFNLSKREIEVLTYISNGLNNEDIAKKMFVSKNTIKTHITHIYSKLDVKNRVQAIQKIKNY